jgi:hypothetical protein
MIHKFTRYLFPLPVVLASSAKDSDPMTMKAKLQDYVSERVAYYKKLRGGIVFVESIPKRLVFHRIFVCSVGADVNLVTFSKSPSGKILRKNLRDLKGIVYM